MEIAKGYKQTDLGIIPSDWDYDTLKENIIEMTDFVAAGSFESLRNNVNVFDTENYALYVRLFDIRLGLGHIRQKYVDEISYKFLSKSNLYGEELLIANIGSNVGEVFLMPTINKPATIAPNMIIVRANKKKIQHKFLYYYSTSYLGQKCLSELIAGSGQPKLNKTDLKNFKVVIPPINEQNAISHVLSDVDSFINKIEKLIEKKLNIKQGLLQKLLKPKKEWKKERIKDIVQIPVTDGPHETPIFYEMGIPFLSVNNLVNNKIDFAELRYISKEDHLIFSKKCKPQKGDILLGKAASVGKVAIVETEAEFNIWSPIALIRLKKEYNPVFVYYYLQTKEIVKQIEFYTNSSSQGNIGMGDIEKIEILIPKTLVEQKEIANILSDIDSEISILEIKKAKIKMLKQGMMQELLTGKTRLV